jgi:hypothetical protein
MVTSPKCALRRYLNASKSVQNHRPAKYSPTIGVFKIVSYIPMLISGRVKNSSLAYASSRRLPSICGLPAWVSALSTRERPQITCNQGSPSVMRRISGRCQRGIRYALWALGEATTMEILDNCYPWPGEDRRQRKNRARAVCLAARKMAIVVGRTWPGGNLWRLKDAEPEA